MSEAAQGTHGGKRRPGGGWPNCKEPEVKPGRGIRRARKKLEGRIAAWEELQKMSKSHHMGGFRKPGSLKVK